MAGPAPTTSLIPLPTISSQAPSSTPTTPATPTTTSSSPTPSTTNVTPPSSSASSAASSASSAATSTQSSSSTGGTSTSALTTAQVVTSGGSVETITSTAIVVSTESPSSQSNATHSNSFFSNTGAVAGVFTVVGLIVSALVIALIINAVRRRRAQKFDRDVAEAAAEAAASSRSPFDDYPYNNSGGNGGGGGGGYGYSDNSHGTYQLPPVAPHTDAYGMTEMSQYDPYAPGAASLAANAVGRSRSRKDSETGAPGIAGVGAGALGREPSKRAPYHAFAGPGPQPHELQTGNGTFGNRRSNQDVLEAVGLAAGAGTAAMAGHNGASGAYVTRQPSDATQATHFNGGRSQFGSMSSGGHHPPTLQPGYPVESYYPHRNDSLSPDPFAGYPPVTSAPSKPLPNPHDVTAAPRPSIAGHQSDHNEDYVESSSPTALRSDEQRMSYQDDADYSHGNRVLRVANE